MVNKKNPNPSHDEEDQSEKQESTRTRKNKNRSLPIDVVAVILSRLPAKDVAKFRCVCKEWFYLTHDPCFLKSLRERSSSYIIISKYVVGGSINLCDFSNADVKKPTMSTCRLNLGRKYYMLSNFVDGLTCAYAATSKSRVYLLNPMTRELQEASKKSGCHERHSRGKFWSWY
ncbi:uncharacterized protein A4U43_C03F20880 [Asparagus officinalis]|uniref:F-box domain-containing protein n=1 Tax=Asparagus officinalis TaxID=4686 RepID=A0A5P1FEJ6_ASPOF|nr:uncharacterized protein A4U43_C03F20880 [Asparagus officinalis]